MVEVGLRVPVLVAVRERLEIRWREIRVVQNPEPVLILGAVGFEDGILEPVWPAEIVTREPHRQALLAQVNRGAASGTISSPEHTVEVPQHMIPASVRALPKVVILRCVVPRAHPVCESKRIEDRKQVELGVEISTEAHDVWARCRVCVSACGPHAFDEILNRLRAFPAVVLQRVSPLIPLHSRPHSRCC